MKKLLLILLSITMLLSACTQSAIETNAPATESPVTEPPETESPVTEPPVTEPPETESPVTETPDVPVIPDSDREDFKILVQDDTYVINADSSGDTSNKSFHDSARMHAKSTAGPSLRRFSYVKFDISELYNAGVFGSVELTLTLAFRQKNDGDPENIRVNVYACEDWGDKKLTYNEQPARYGLISYVDDITTKDETYFFPITDYVKQAMADGKTTIALMIEEATPETALHVQFYTKEDNMDKAAKLEISYQKVDTGKYEKPETEDLPEGLDVILNTSASTKTQSLTAIEDSYVSGGENDMTDAANTVLGKSAILDFKANYTGKTEQHRIVYVKFDLSGYGVGDFDRATLRLYCKSEQSSEGADIKVFACDPNAWSEDTLTYSTRPESGKLITTASKARKGFVSIELTDYVNECLKNGKTTISVALEGDTTLPRRMTFNSTESGNNPPCLMLSGSASSFSARLDYTGVNPWSYAMKLVNTWTENRKTVMSGGASTSEKVSPISEEYNQTVDAATYQLTDGLNTQYTSYATRTVDSLKGYTYNTAESSKYDVYGGYTGGKKYEATGYFYTKFIDGRWWTIDPLGYPFFRTAVVGISRGSSNQASLALSMHGSVENWAQASTDRLRELGFNSAGGWSDITNLAQVNKPLAQTKILYLMRNYANSIGVINANSGSTEFIDGVMPVFDPAFVEYCDRDAANQLTPYANNSDVYGWMSDNELRMVLKTLDNYLNCDPAKHAFAYSYATAWTYMYVMTGKTNVSLSDVTDELRHDFLAMIYDRYFSVVEAAVHKYAPNHMYLGCRFIGENYYDESVMRVAGNYCDVISFNYYKEWTPDFEFISNVQKWTNTPFIVTEWYAKGMDVWEQDNRMTNKSGSGWSVRTQADRGLFYQNFALGLLESKYCVGFDWFQYLDNDPDNLNADPSNRDANKGIYSNKLEEYTDLTEEMKYLNKNIYPLIEFFDAR